MDILPDFGKNAAYIWACYGLGLILIAGAVIAVLMKAQSARKALERMQIDDERPA
jgi:heme exporter protein CcmD